MKFRVDPRAELSETDRQVNRLVRKAFGVFYSGNNHVFCGGLDGVKEKIPYLETIARPTLLGDPLAGCGVAGSLSSDGTKIKVRRGRTWERRAFEYARLYEQTFGRQVEITVTDQFF